MSPPIPDGWRLLDVGEVLREGDAFYYERGWLGVRFSSGGRVGDPGFPPPYIRKVETHDTGEAGETQAAAEGGKEGQKA